MIRLAGALLAVVLVACGCGPPADVAGVWRGSWGNDDGSQRGELTLVLEPRGGELSGQLALWQDLPSLRNDGATVTGSVGASTVRFTFQSSDNPHRFEGDVAGDALSGQVEYFGRVGTWQATRIASDQITLGRVVSVPCFARALTFGAGRLWSVCEAIVDVDPTTGAVHSWPRPDPTDDRFRLSGCQAGAAWHGGRLWCADGGPTLAVIDPEQGRVGELTLEGPARCQQPWFDGDHPWCVHAVTGEVRRYDATTGQSLGLNGPWRSALGVVRRGDELLVLLHYPKVLLRVGAADGALRGAHRFEVEAGAFTLAHATDGATVWLLVSTVEGDARAFVLDGL